jgi:DNA anti-recombination protein RmuC
MLHGNPYRPVAGPEAQVGELERLIAAEARIGARIEQAATEALALVASARRRAEEAERRSREELEEATARLEREVEQDRIRQLRSVAEDLDRHLAFLQAVTEDRITELAAHALGRLLQPTNADRRL